MNFERVQRPTKLYLALLQELTVTMTSAALVGSGPLLHLAGYPSPLAFCVIVMIPGKYISKL